MRISEELSQRICGFQKCLKPLLAFIWVVILFGCARSSAALPATKEPVSTITAQRPLQVVTQTPQPTRIKESSVTLSPVPTLLTPTLEVSTPAQDIETIPVCLSEGNPEKSEGRLSTEGSILYTHSDENTLWALTGDKLRSKVLGPGKNYFFGASPDGKWLAYMPWLSPDEAFKQPLSQVPFFLLSNTGQTVEKEIDLTGLNSNVKDPLFFFYFYPTRTEWVSDSLLQLRANYFEGPYHSGLPFMQYDYFNPLANAWVEDPSNLLPGYQPFQRTERSPDNTRILYANSDKVAFMLWDLEQGKALWQDDRYINLNISDWDAASQYLAFVSYPKNESSQGYIIQRDGKQLKQIKRLLSHGQLLDFNYSVMRWSPDNRYLAITGQIYGANPDQPENVLLIYDQISETFTYRCPAWYSPAFDGAPNIIWSPDGENILLSIPVSQIKPPLIYYDLKGGSTHFVAEDGIALGWFRQSFLP